MFSTHAQSKGGQATALKQKKEALERYLSNPNYCLTCNSLIKPKPNQRLAEVRIKKYCNHSCAAKFSNKTRIRILKPKPLKVEKSKIEYNPTKEELFTIKPTWQAARSYIQKQARKTYLESNKPRQCIVCGYNNHIEIAHIKSVASFNKEVTILEINQLSNLVALCPNHHWEYDAKLIEL